jgi:hypothetical protein
MMTTEEALERLEGVEFYSARNARALCPAHDDVEPSLSVGTGYDGRLLLYCHAGCEFADILAALEGAPSRSREKAPGGSQEPRRAAPWPEGDPEAVYTYTNEWGDPLFEVVRFPGKVFRQRLPDGTPGRRGVRDVVYHLPEVIRSDRVFVVEGEKDVEALRERGMVATCSPGGAGKWKPDYADWFVGSIVYVVADQDPAGIRHAIQVKQMLGRVARKIILLAPRAGKDAYDHLAAGYTPGEFVRGEL